VTTPEHWRRIAVAIAGVAVVALVLLLQGPDGGSERDSGTPPGDSSPSPTPSPTAAPGSVSAEEFCAAFQAMAAAHANHLANDTEESGLEVAATAARVLELGAGTRMSAPARAGLAAQVDGVLGTGTAAPDPVATNAFSGYLAESCPAGAPR
jgi:hypothetical protein